MHWLNYHHLLYFWTVVREGSVTRAADKLFISQPTVSGQLRELERAVGERLYEKSGRDLKLTDTGRMVYEYADEIFTTGQELMSRLQGKRGNRAQAFGVGVPDVMPKLIATRLIAPLFQLQDPVRVVCREAKLTELLVELAQRRLDVVLSDSEVGSQADIRAFNHLLGECEIELLCSPEWYERLQAGFPGSLAGAPLLLPTDGSVLRRTVSQWLQEMTIEPNLVGEIEDSAMLKSLAGLGVGVVPVASAVREDAIEQHGLRVLGAIPQVKLRFFAITIERKVTHPAVRVLLESAERDLFGARP